LASTVKEAFTRSEDVFPVPAEWAKRAWSDHERYVRDYERSIRDPEGYWAEQAEHLDWFRKPSKIKDVSFRPGDVHIRWYEDGILNAAANCLDRHLAKRGDQTAILW